MKSPPAIKKRAGRVESHGAEPKEKTDILQQSADIHASPEFLTSWTVPPDTRDGLEIGIGSKGHILLTQNQPFEHETAIILHPTEARALLEILPDAISAACRHRKEME
jgi:hypothetical protein